jgi:enolase
LAAKTGVTPSLPVPMMNIINGGAHADNPSTSRSS